MVPPPPPPPLTTRSPSPERPAARRCAGGLSGPPDVLIHPWAGARGFGSSRGIPVFGVGRCGLARDTPSIFRLLRSFLSSIGKGTPLPGLPGAVPPPSSVHHRSARVTPSPALRPSPASCASRLCGSWRVGDLQHQLRGRRRPRAGGRLASPRAWRLPDSPL